MSEVKLKQIRKEFGTKCVIPALDLEIPNGAFVALLGPSGCGKTTLLRMVAGLESPTGGEVWLGDRPVYSKGTTVPPEERKLGMVFQSYAVWPHMNVFENVAYPLRIRKLPAEEIRRETLRALELVHLTELQERFPHQLSGGQQQRVALARGLAMKPSVLLLDEPLSNLDARLRSEMRREIRDLHRKLGMTILYVTHDQREAFEMSTHVVVLNEGRIAQQGSPEEIKRSPAPGFVQEFLSD
jgi:iron(III) transport system ATP-binding protein